MCKALEFGEEILRQRWSILWVVLAAAIHSKRLWDPHWPRDPHSPIKTGQDQMLLCASHLRDCHRQRFFFSCNKELCRADQGGTNNSEVAHSCHSCWQYKARWLRWVTGRNLIVSQQLTVAIAGFHMRKGQLRTPPSLSARQVGIQHQTGKMVWNKVTEWGIWLSFCVLWIFKTLSWRVKETEGKD